MVNGFFDFDTRSSTAFATSAAGGFDTMTMCLVAGSASSRSIAIRVVMPPTSFLRSRPPVPIACDMPRPARAIRQEISWMPVPDAPTMPMSPRGTTLANARGTPPMIAVPQSGPMTRRPSVRASRFNSTSCSIGTLSEKIITSRPERIAFKASAAAKSPGTEISARLASGVWARAARSVRGRHTLAPTVWRGASSKRAASARAASAEDLSLARIAMTRSPGAAASPLVSSTPASRRISLLADVPIMRPASSIPSIDVMLRAMRISATLSR